MPPTDAYARRVGLLVEVLPFVANERTFALEGGTAINLFVRDLPRLSVDIDLTFLPVTGRGESLAAIDVAMHRLADTIQNGLERVHVRPVVNQGIGIVTKLLIQHPGAQVKLEVTPVMRGCVYDPEERDVTPTVEERFGYARMQVVSFADLYGGKLVAALDRQHPRDLFDVRELLANEGITDDLRRAFIAYLISHDRSVADVLDAHPKDLAFPYASDFAGMSPDHRVTADDLMETRRTLVAEVIHRIPDPHKEFLIGFERGQPDWDLLAVPGVSELPAVRWKQHNLDRLDPAARARAARRLANILAGPATRTITGGSEWSTNSGQLYSDYMDNP